jgi:hypothetical protein
MNNQAEIIEDDDEELDTEMESETEVDDEEEADEAGADVDSEDEEGDEDDVVIEIAGESPPPEDDAKAPEWVRDLRKSHREQQRENKQLKDQLAKLSSTVQPKTVELGKKPTIEAADYDSDLYEQQLTDWFDRKKAVEAQQERQEAERRSQQDAWNATLATYGEHRKTLKVKDFEDAETVVQDELSNTQQGMILQGADNPALVVYALGKNPKKAKEIASIKDPVKFAFAVAKLETQLKVTNRKASTKPETTITGKAMKSGTVDSNLERLRAQAEKAATIQRLPPTSAASVRVVKQLNL